MKTVQLSITHNNYKDVVASIDFTPNLFLLFVSPDFSATQVVLDALKTQFSEAIIIGCSTAGEISGVSVKDETIALTAIALEKTKLKKVAFTVRDKECSETAGKDIAKALVANDLKHILILSDGLNVNGADLVTGLKHEVPDVTITGGLAGDGANFNKTFVVDGSKMLDKTILGLGFYGDSLKVGCSSKGGWDSFGIDRLVTKSDKNVLYELDGKPALQIYKSFLGAQAANLPSSGLLFPLSLRVTEDSKPVVRTILGISEEAQSLTFAGNIPQGAYVRLMKANIDRLILGAEDSAQLAKKEINEDAQLAILISCVGRRLVLKQLVEEEIEVVKEVVGDTPSITGFYSYGEIAPFGEFSPCELHNQTMTITTLAEC